VLNQGTAMAADAAPAPIQQPKAKIFISYSRKNLSFADRLEAALKARGFEVLIDRTDIYAFEDWWKRIQSLIEQADTVVFILSPDAVASEVALKEVIYAASLNKRFAPIVCRRVENSAVPEALRRLNFIFFDDPDSFDASANKLAEALQTDIGWIRKHTEYSERAREWTENSRAFGLLMRPPLLDQAETWLGLRPTGAPSPTAETEEYVAESRRSDSEIRIAETKTKRRWRFAQVAIFVLMIGIILGLVGIIEQDFVKAQWRYWTVTFPYMRAQVRPYVLSAAKEQALKPGESFKECAQDCPAMVVVPAGSFTMGGPANVEQPQYYGANTEQPQHTVTFAKPFAVSKYQLTFADWDACVAAGGCDDYKPSDTDWGRGPQPVINVSWEDAQQYLAWLSEVTGKTYRLLSESEYEYAARAGTTTAYPWGDDIGKNNADCNGCGSQWDAKQTAPVGSFAPNRFGLYDMVGNVFEWTEDCIHDNYIGAPADGSVWTSGGDCGNHVIRGGSWLSDPVNLRSDNRVWLTSPDRRDSGLGFRVARTLLAP
jgi:formylglycine-generating enzyme required for sulfatase activity